MSKYINPFTDFGFKKLFGEEASKPLLIDFLSNLLPETEIIDLTFKDKEKYGQIDAERRAVYDIYCDTKKGEKIIVELQKAKQKYFKDRTIYYSTFPIQEQAEKNEWDYALKSVYCVGILDFVFEDVDENKGEVIHHVQLKNQNNAVFYDKLKFVYLEMPNFNKKEHQLNNRLDKWLFFIKHLNDFYDIPEIFKDDLFQKAFEKAQISNYSESELAAYHDSLKKYRDLKGVVDTAFVEGKIEGKIEEKSSVIQNGLKIGLSIENLMLLTGLTKVEILKLIDAITDR
ncbi:MAG: Rpn family recombination-promoting nuclease/putative transposase [Bacteroidetes bacterium]|nr:MAG: Rpn family recombination-promoting nuclease/putative transposase [Bacteroidota bacterium]